MKNLIRSLLGDKILGMLDFYRYPSWKKSWGGYANGAFNGQKFRCKIFSDLVNAFEFKAIFETGTFHGSTTEFMTTLTKSPIFTVEGQERTFGYCCARFWNNKQVNLFYGDSRKFLKQQLYSQSLEDVPIFLYLDAHWNEDLPLLEEIEIILDARVNAVIMIDDFQVVNDSGYIFDDYGLSKSLTVDYLSPFKHKITPFFPNCPSSEETGARKGCVVLGTNEEVTGILKDIKTLSMDTEFNKS